MMRVRSISMPGTLRGADPVATMISLRARSVCVSPSKTSTPPLPVEPRGSLDPVDLVLLEQELDALGQAGDDAILARLHLRHVDADGGRRPERHAPLLGVAARPSARARARAAPWSECIPTFRTEFSA